MTAPVVAGALAGALAASHLALCVLLAPILPRILSAPLLTTALWAGGLGFCLVPLAGARLVGLAFTLVSPLAALSPALFLAMAGGLRRPDLEALLASAVLALLPFACGLWMGSRTRGDAVQFARALLGAGAGALLGRLALDHVAPVAVLACALSVLALCPLAVVRSPARPGAVALCLASALTILAGALYARSAASPSLASADIARLSRWAEGEDAHLLRDFAQWDASGLAEVWSAQRQGQGEPLALSVLAHNGRAVSPIARKPGLPTVRVCGRSVHGLPHVSPRRAIAVLGPQALDIACALELSEARVDVFEHRPALRRALRVHAPQSSRVRYHALSPRSAATAQETHYDLVVWPPAGGLPLLSAPLSAPLDVPLWTRTGVSLWLQRLSPAGVLSLVAFGRPQAIRAVHTVFEALQEAGAKSPRDHLVIAQSGRAYVLLVRRQSWPLDEVLALHERYRDMPAHTSLSPLDEVFGWSLGPNPQLRYTPGAAFDNAIADFVAHAARGDAERIAAGHTFDLTPTTDARPYFAQLTRLDTPGLWQRTAPPRVLRRHAALMSALSLVLLATLAWRERGRGDRLAGLAAWLSGAAAPLGFALLLHELSLRGHAEHAFFIAVGVFTVGSVVAMLATRGAAASHRDWAVAGGSAGIAITGSLVLFLGYPALGFGAGALLATALVLMLTAHRFT